MDTMGDGEELDYDDGLAPPRPSLLTTEALAVTSVVLGVLSVWVTSLTQYLAFLLVSSFGNTSNNESTQVALFTVPVAVVALLGFVCGLTAMKRRPADRWVGALSVAGAAASGLILVLTVGTLVFSWVHGSSVYVG